MKFLDKMAQQINQLDTVLGKNYPEELERLRRLLNKYKLENQDIIEEEGDLKIGIVGQVKAGKSSFLNALIFDGQNILPKASTPMTAALTKIKYSQEIKAEVEYYTTEDWDIIAQNASQYDEQVRQLQQEALAEAKQTGAMINIDQMDFSGQISMERKACKEIHEMYQKSGLSASVFNQTETIANIDSTTELMGRLSSYVGVDGKYTSVVKSCTLYINDPNLKGLEIIDTPGTNDPIVSRGRVTREYLSSCNLVFMLSFSGQFLGQEDVGFILNTLPINGIQAGVIIASKFDSVLLDVQKQKNIEITYKKLALKLHNQAQDIFSSILEQNPTNQVARQLKKDLPPLFISSMAYNIYQHFDNLNETKYREEKHIYTQLNNKFNIDKEVFKSLNGFHKAQQKLDQARINKDILIKENMQAKAARRPKQYAENLGDFQALINRNMDLLSNKTMDEIQKNHDKILEKINQVSSEIHLELDNILYTIDENKMYLTRSLNDELSNESFLDYDEQVRQRDVHTHTTGIFFKDKHYRTESYTVVNNNNAMDNCFEFFDNVKKIALKSLSKIIDKEKITQNMKQIIIHKIYDNEDIIFEKGDLEYPLTQTLNKINIPQLSISQDTYSRQITTTFSQLGSGSSEGSAIYNLKSTQKGVQRRILNDFIEVDLNQYYHSIKQELQQAFSNILNNFKIKLDEDLQELKSRKENEEANLNKHENILAVLNDSLDEIENNYV